MLELLDVEAFLPFSTTSFSYMKCVLVSLIVVPQFSPRFALSFMVTGPLVGLQAGSRRLMLEYVDKLYICVGRS